MSSHRPPAIIIGGDSANGLGVAHSLASYGIDVYCLTSDRYELTRFSRCCAGSAVIPNIERDPATLQRALRRLATRLPGKAVVFPTTDDAVPTVAAIRNSLSPYVTFIPDKAIVDTMVNKQQFYHSLRQHGIPHPQVMEPASNDLQTIVDQLTLPIYVRPASSRAFVHMFGVKGFVARTVDALQQYLELAHSVGLEVMLQEIIPGSVQQGYAFRGYFNQQSQLLVHLTTQKIRQASMFANPVVVASTTVSPHSALAAFQRRLVTYFTSMGYTGLFGAEVKWDARDRQFKLLEVNPRSQGGCYISTASGREDLYAAYLDALGEEVPPMGTVTVGLHSIALLQDLTIIVRRLLQGRPVSHVIAPYLQKKKIWHGLYNRDWRPFLVSVLTFLEFERLKYRQLRSYPNIAY